MKRLLLPLLACLIAWLPGCQPVPSALPDQPNILWLSSEDMNAFLGAYGDPQAITPHLDQLAAEGVIYDNAFATAPVCSPARSCLITGVYASSMGSQHLRSEVTKPEFLHGFPTYLREAGYYCSNNYKEDYNFADTTIWDESSHDAHWRDRQPGQPFFSVFNFETTHQSKIFGSDSVFYEKYGQYLSESERHDPATIFVPPYHFDSPDVRKFWARYYDLVTIMDRQAGEILAQLEADGLAEETIIFYFADHGTGMPRSKRALYDSGLKVPLIIKAPAKWQKALGLEAGTHNADLVSFADFAPTLLSLVGLDIPDYVQGQVFLGPEKQSQGYVFGHSDRVDEAYEISRTVRSPRFRYVRNYLPHLPLIQRNFYTDQSEILQELRRIRALGELNPAQASMWQESRLPEELYDTKNDPFEVRNLARDPAWRDTLVAMRQAQRDWALRTYDSGLLPEADMHAIAAGSTIYEALRQPELFPQREILDLCAGMMATNWEAESLLPSLEDERAPIRYWAAMLLQIRGWESAAVTQALTERLQDPVASVRLTSAQALCNHGECADALAVVLAELAGENPISRLLAARTFEELIDRAGPILPQVRALMQQNCPQEDRSQYYKLYSCWALEEAMAVLP